jgi:hypothetical protein
MPTHQTSRSHKLLVTQLFCREYRTQWHKFPYFRHCEDNFVSHWWGTTYPRFHWTLLIRKKLSFILDQNGQEGNFETTGVFSFTAPLSNHERHKLFQLLQRKQECNMICWLNNWAWDLKEEINAKPKLAGFDNPLDSDPSETSEEYVKIIEQFPVSETWGQRTPVL